MWLLLTLVLAIDGGVPDAGLTKWSWVDGDGGWIGDGGITDFLSLRVGETAHVKLPLPIVLMQCDEQLLSLDATDDTLLLTGAKAGHTFCGFWFTKRDWPHRYFEVTVTKAATSR